MASFTVATIDYHTAGESFRIVAEPPAPIHGNAVAERRALAIDDADVDFLWKASGGLGRDAAVRLAAQFSVV
jgi:proline racemase